MRPEYTIVKGNTSRTCGWHLIRAEETCTEEAYRYIADISTIPGTIVSFLCESHILEGYYSLTHRDKFRHPVLN